MEAVVDTVKECRLLALRCQQMIGQNKSAKSTEVQSLKCLVGVLACQNRTCRVADRYALRSSCDEAPMNAAVVVNYTYIPT